MGQLVGRSVGRLVCWSVGRSVDWLISWSIILSVSWSVGWFGWSVSQSGVGQLVGESVRLSARQLGQRLCW